MVLATEKLLEGVWEVPHVAGDDVVAVWMRPSWIHFITATPDAQAQFLIAAWKRAVLCDNATKTGDAIKVFFDIAAREAKALKQVVLHAGAGRTWALGNSLRKK